MKATRRTVPIADRLFAQLEQMPNGCVEFQGSKVRKGYGSITNQGRHYRAHRVAWWLTYGPIPDGPYVCHTCDNPPCCNPEHLFLGTPTDNARDRSAKNRTHNGRKTHCKRGHEFTPENTYLPPSGIGRNCRACSRSRTRLA